jgi:hypothetical protein
MHEKITDYLENTVMPVIRRRHPQVLGEISVMILGSVGLGLDDEHSDLEAGIYLDDPVWKQFGGQLQLSLNELVREANPWKADGSLLSVYPQSWLLDHQGIKFLQDSGTPPWGKVSFEALYEMQENLIYYDPKGVLSGLRAAAAPDQYPDALWKKALITNLRQLVYEDFSELRQCVLRKLPGESCILLGQVLKELYQLGFLVCRRYYPWRKHIRWAFDRLPEPVSGCGARLDAICDASDWYEKIKLIQSLIDDYLNYIESNGLLPEIDFKRADLNNELIWSDRLKAWENPDWRCWIDRCTQKAAENGYPEYQYWVWSLWNWVNEEPESLR